MATLETSLSDFTGTYANLNGTHSLNLSYRKCLKFATTVGLSQLRTTHPNTTALSLATYRAMAVKCALDFNGPILKLQSGYDQLETSEKASISYWIGMTIAGVLADQFLHVPRLIHATQLHGSRIRRSNRASKSLADLIGISNNGDYHVVEAKGRQKAPSAGTELDWKTQAGTIASINNIVPSTRSYSLALISHILTAKMVDPPSGDQKNTLDLVGDPKLFDIGYYAPFRKFLSPMLTQVITRGNARCRVRVIAWDPQEDVYVFVGLREGIPDGSCSIQQFPKFEEYDGKDAFIGTDGVVVITGSNPCELS